jgi:hypothetical protein
MAYNTVYPTLQKSFFAFLNLQKAGEQTAEDAALYEYIDNLFTVCFAMATDYCSQPLQSTVVTYEFSVANARSGFESLHKWKYIPYSNNVALSSFSWRANEFDTYTSMDINDYKFTNDDGSNFIIIRNKEQGQFKAVINVGWTEQNTPLSIVQGITEMAVYMYKTTANGSNWFGLSSISTAGAGQNVNNNLLADVNWKKYFSKFKITVV